MTVKPKKLFISYRSSDAHKVDKIARDLGLLQHADGTPRYTTWQDKLNLPPASPHWWDAIVDAIEGCDVFVFHMSRESLQSAVCLAELDYAHNRNRPIIPVVLEGEFFLDSQSGKYNIGYWELVPDWLGEQQFLFYTGTDFFGRFQQAIEMFESNWPRDVYAARPLNPDSKSVHGSNHALYDSACDYAERLAFEDAKKHFNALVRRNDKDYAEAAAQWLELVALYAELIEINERKSARFLFNKKWAAYQALFPKDFLDGIFDPKGFDGRNGGENIPVGTQVATTEATAPVTPKAAPTIMLIPEPVEWNLVEDNEDVMAAPALVSTEPASNELTSIALMPKPFEWIAIRGGRGTMKTNNSGVTLAIPTEPYWMSKYPITNAQYAKFIDEEGYQQPKWWTKESWQKREHEDWTEPRHWTDSQWNGTEQPVVGVSWYEAVAFCLWLSEATGEKIMLPTEARWQYSAQGDDGRTFPWGNGFDRHLCNNNVDQRGIGKTTPVRQYEGKGDSPFGVVDMAGNVWEWCLTDYNDETDDIHTVTFRVFRGGSWNTTLIDWLRCLYRDGVSPDVRGHNLGFRITRA